MVSILRTPAEVRRWRSSLDPQRKVAFVPTMGFLHEGHLSLLREGRARVPAQAGSLVLSIFVNPTQFGPGEDLDRYPRDEQGDLEKARGCGVDVAFCPTDPDAMYPTRLTWVDVEGLSQGLCGRSRPGHFRGVCTVVIKLWNLIQPDVALFGQKDYQQLAILRRMHADLFLSGEIVGMPIVREPDGLAMSSRNAYLTADQRKQALRLPTMLQEVATRFGKGERSVPSLLAGTQDAVAPGRVDYIEVVDAANLQPLDRIERPALVAAAVHFGNVRLIDNRLLDPAGS